MRARTVIAFLGFVLVVVCAVQVVHGEGDSASSSEIQTILDGLRGQPFDEFVDESYKQILLRSPEDVTSLGLSESFGIRDDTFVDETYELKAGILGILQTYRHSTLGYDQQISDPEC